MRGSEALAYLVVAILTVLPAASYAGDKCLVLGVVTKQPYSDVARRVIPVLQEAGVCAKLSFLPQKRIAAMLKAGKIDGEMIRIPAYQIWTREFTFMVTTAIGEATGLFVAADPHLKTLDNWRIRAVGMERGVLWPKRLLRDRFDTNIATNSGQLLEMLKHGRVQAIFLNSVVWEHHKAKYPTFHAHEIVDLSGHIYLLNKHLHYRETIARAIRPFRQKGGSFVD